MKHMNKMKKFRIGFSLLSLSTLFVAQAAFAGPTPSPSQQAQILISCDSEDDGVGTGILKENRPGSLYFDGEVASMSENRMVRISGHAEDFRALGRNEHAAFVRLCVFNRDYDVPVTCAGVSEAVLKENRATRVDLFALGQMDPEGINCQLTLKLGS